MGIGGGKEMYRYKFGIFGVLAIVIGAGNFWSFPYRLYVNGGGTYLYPFIISLFAIAVPIAFCEFAIGQKNKEIGFVDDKKINDEKKRVIRVGPYFAILSTLVLVPILSIVGGWSLNYFAISVSNGFDFYYANSDIFYVNNVGNIFMSFSFQFSLFFLGTIVSVASYNREINILNKFSLLFFTVCILFVFFFTYIEFGYSQEAIENMFTFVYRIKEDDIFSLINIIVGESLFALSVGAGILILYTRFTDNEVKGLFSVGYISGIFSLLISLIITYTIFNIFSNSMLLGKEGYYEIINKPGMIFIAFPILFSKMANGNILGMLFFLSLTILVFTEMVTMLKVLYSNVGMKVNLSNGAVRLLCVLAIIPISIVFQLGFRMDINLSFVPDILNKNILNQQVLYKAYNIAIQYGLPMGGLIACRFFSKKIDSEFVLKYFRNKKTYKFFAFYVGNIIPVILIFIMVSSIISNFF